MSITLRDPASEHIRCGNCLWDIWEPRRHSSDAAKPNHVMRRYITKRDMVAALAIAMLTNCAMSRESRRCERRAAGSKANQRAAHFLDTPTNLLERSLVLEACAVNGGSRCLATDAHYGRAL